MKHQKFLTALRGAMRVLSARADRVRAAWIAGAMPAAFTWLGLAVAGLCVGGCRTGAGGGQALDAGDACCITSPPPACVVLVLPEGPVSQALTNMADRVEASAAAASTQSTAVGTTGAGAAGTNALPVAGSDTNLFHAAGPGSEQAAPTAGALTNPPPVLLVQTGMPAVVVTPVSSNALSQAERAQADVTPGVETNRPGVAASGMDSFQVEHAAACETNRVAGTASPTNTVVEAIRLEKPLPRAARVLSGWTSVGAVYAFETIDTREDFAYGELRAAYSLDELIHVHDRLDLQVGVGAGVFTDEENDPVGFACIGPMLVCSLSDLNLTFEIGSRFGFLSNDNLGIESFGGQVHFLSHASFRWNMGHNWQCGLRGQHLSNAGLEDVNPGIDLLAFELLYVR